MAKQKNNMNVGPHDLQAMQMQVARCMKAA